MPSSSRRDAAGRLARLHRHRTRARPSRRPANWAHAPSSPSSWAPECLGVHTGEASGQRGLQRGGLRALPARAAPTRARWSNWCASRRRASPRSRRHGGLRGRRPEGGRVRRLSGPHRRPADPALPQRRAAPARREAGHRRGHGQDAVPGPRLSRRPDLAAGAHRARRALRRDAGALYQALGQEAYAPARRAQVAKARAGLPGPANRADPAAKPGAFAMQSTFPEPVANADSRPIGTPRASAGL